MSDLKHKPVCNRCGSDNVVADGPASYDADKQEWVLISTYDGGHCEDCDAEIKHFDWVEVTP